MSAPVNPLRPAPGTPRPYEFPALTRHLLPNGLAVWLVPLPDRAVVSVHLLFDAGAAAEDEERGGVAALTAQLLVTGTQRLDPSAFAEATEQLGIELGTESAWDSSRAGFHALAERIDEGLALLAEMIRQPRLDGGEFERLKAERLDDILQARADPGRLADESFLQHLYADGAAYGRPSAGTQPTVQSLTLDDVRDFHTTHYLPTEAHLVVAGRFEPDAVLRAAAERFGDWRGRGSGHRPLTAEPRGGRRVVLVDRPGSVQTELRVGQVGIDRYDPRLFPAIVMAAILGGTIGSRLSRRLREELGYTYHVRAGFDPRRSAGPLLAATAVQSEVTVPAIGALLEQIDRLRAEPPPAAELREVKDYLIGVFPLRFESTPGIAWAIEPLAVYGLPDDWWTTYRRRLEEVDESATHAAAQQLIDPDRLLILAVGDASRIATELGAAGYGSVEVVRDGGPAAGG